MQIHLNSLGCVLATLQSFRSRLEGVCVCVCGVRNQVLSTQRYKPFWSATFLQPSNTVATAKVTKMQYSWKDNSLQPFDIIQKTIFSSASFWETSTSIFTFFRAGACLLASLPACLSACQMKFGMHYFLQIRSAENSTSTWLNPNPNFSSKGHNSVTDGKRPVARVHGRTGRLPGVSVNPGFDGKKAASSFDIPWIN